MKAMLEGSTVVELTKRAVISLIGRIYMIYLDFSLLLATVHFKILMQERNIMLRLKRLLLAQNDLMSSKVMSISSLVSWEVR